MGTISSNFASGAWVNSTQLSSATEIGNFSAGGNTVASSRIAPVESIDIEEAVELEKSVSLAYQLMLAIARENANHHSSPENQDTSTLSQFLTNNSANAMQDFGSLGIILSEQDLGNLQYLPTGFSMSSVEFSASFFFTQQQSLNIEIASETGEFVINLSLSTEMQLSFSVNQVNNQPQQADPLILNLAQTDYSFLPSEKIVFDLNADGQLDEFTNLTTANAFLAYDKNNNGFIDNGLELFGDAGGAVDGFADLATYDENNDGQISANDKIFENLLLLQFDANGNQNLRKLSAESISAIYLSAQQHEKTYQANNQLILESNYQKKDGSSGKIGDFLLSIKSN